MHPRGWVFLYRYGWTEILPILQAHTPLSGICPTVMTVPSRLWSFSPFHLSPWLFFLCIRTLSFLQQPLVWGLCVFSVGGTGSLSVIALCSAGIFCCADYSIYKVHYFLGKIILAFNCIITYYVSAVQFEPLTDALTDKTKGFSICRMTGMIIT